MARIVSIALFFFVLGTSALAVDSKLELKVLTPQKKEVEPGMTINVMVVINNPTDENRQAHIRLNSNDGIAKLIADYSSITINKNSSLRKVVGIQISQSIRAGDFSLIVELLEMPELVSFGKIDIPILVKPKYEISITKLKSPSYIFSGDNVDMSYLIQNYSNLDVKVKTTTLRGSESKNEEFSIPKDSGIVTNFHTSTSKKIDGHTLQSVIVIAQIVDRPETETSVYTSYDIFPSESVKFDKYERFPIKISSIFASSNRLGKQMWSGMYDIQGIGVIGKKNDANIDFHLRGPDRTGNPLFGMNDEYYLKFRSTNLFAALGDYNFGLSELTESSRNGRGIELRYKLKKWTIGSYYNMPRYYPLVKNVAAAYSSFNFNPNNSLSVGYLTKLDTLKNRLQLFSLSAHNRVFSVLSTEAELAMGLAKSEFSKAYKASINLNLPKFNSHLVYLYSDPVFPGFVTNSLRMNVGSALQLRKFSLSVNYDVNSTNMALDTLYANMPHSRNINMTTSYRITAQNTLSLSGNMVSLEDQSPTPLFNYEKTSGRISLQSKVKSFNLSMNADVGKMKNKLPNIEVDESLFYNSTFTMFYLFNKNFSASAFTTYQGGQRNVTGFDQFYYGGSFIASLKERLSLSLQYNSNYEWRFYTSDRSLFSMNLYGKINDNNEINLMANYNLMRNTLDKKEYNIQLRYVHNLNMPVSKKKNIGSVTGKIINHGVEKVGGLLLNLNGNICITDKEGNFKFPAIPVGEYLMNIDASTLGLNAITESPGPFKVLVEPGKVTLFECALTTSGSISGSIRVQEDERANQKGYIPVKESIEKLIVEANNGTDIFRIYTDKEGAFRFDDLRPGKWQVKIYPNGLPVGYKLVSSNFTIDLTSGKHEKIDVAIQKKARQIQFQNSITKK